MAARQVSVVRWAWTDPVRPQDAFPGERLAGPAQHLDQDERGGIDPAALSAVDLRAWAHSERLSRELKKPPPDALSPVQTVAPAAVPGGDGRLGGTVRGAVGEAEGAAGRAVAGVAAGAGETVGRTGAGGAVAGVATPSAGDVLAGAAGEPGAACTAGAGAGPAGGAAGRTTFDFAAVFAASAAASASASPRKCFRASSACSMSSELE